MSRVLVPKSKLRCESRQMVKHTLESQILFVDVMMELWACRIASWGDACWKHLIALVLVRHNYTQGQTHCAENVRITAVGVGAQEIHSSSFSVCLKGS